MAGTVTVDADTYNALLKTNGYGTGFGEVGTTMGNIGAGLQIGTSVASLYNAFENRKLMKEELNLKKAQYADAKQELEHQRKVRSNLTSQFR